MEEHVRLEEEKSRRRGKVYNWETATYALSCEPMVSPLNDNKIDFRISFDESDNEDYTVIYDKNSFFYKIISVNDLKRDLENDNDKVNMPSFSSPKPTVSYFDDLDYFKDFKKDFPTIVYNDALTSKLDFLTEPTVNPQRIDEFGFKHETSLSECDEEEHNDLYFNDLFPFNIIYPNDSNSDKDNDDHRIDIKQSLGGSCVHELCGMEMMLEQWPVVMLILMVIWWCKWVFESLDPKILTTPTSSLSWFLRCEVYLRDSPTSIRRRSRFSSLDEYLQIGDKTSRDCLMAFCNEVMELYGEEFLRRPTQADVEKLYAFYEEKPGFPGMIGSIDYTKWPWAQCPQAYLAQFSRGDSGSEPKILLEAVASQNLPEFPFVGKVPEFPFVANDVNYKWGYYPTDGIYPEWAVLMKSIAQPGSNDVKRIRYKQAHKAARKDVELAFGVLKKKWAIVRTPPRSRSLKITLLMYTCIILHNMTRKRKKCDLSQVLSGGTTS
uniref:Protein ALP1-like n=1 Tax=Tanacetum cinerariifolium TaxID=118510 RepID=A0A699GM59_TANCI|nr:hypothetical protein [Tanacetum cinerariifolium]